VNLYGNSQQVRRGAIFNKVSKFKREAKMGKYKLLCMSFDGDYKIEDNIFDKDTRAFETIADAWERAAQF
jgi:hypothetical protein